VETIKDAYSIQKSWSRALPTGGRWRQQRPWTGPPEKATATAVATPSCPSAGTVPPRRRHCSQWGQWHYHRAAGIGANGTAAKAARGPARSGVARGRARPARDKHFSCAVAVVTFWWWKHRSGWERANEEEDAAELNEGSNLVEEGRMTSAVMDNPGTTKQPHNNYEHREEHPPHEICSRSGSKHEHQSRC